MKLVFAALMLVTFAQVVCAVTSDGGNDDDVYALEELEEIAIANHAALTEAAANISAASGRAYQAGRPENPKVGYTANEIGNGGAAGQHGGFISQTFIRGNKRQLDQAIACQQVHRLQHQYERTRMSVLSRVRQLFYQLLVLQRRIRIHEYLRKVNRQASEVQASLADSGDALELDAVLFDIDHKKSEVDLVALRARRESLKRELAAAVGMPQLLVGDLRGNIHDRIPELTYEQAHTLVIAANPRLAGAQSDIRQSQISLTRARVEPIPDVNVQVAVQYDDETKDTFPSIQVGLPLPLFDQNRGSIREASAAITAATARYRKQRHRLEEQLAAAYGQYHAARVQATRLGTDILPRTLESLAMAERLHEATELSLARLVEVQRRTAETDLQYLDASDKAWQAFQRLMSMLSDEE